MVAGSNSVAIIPPPFPVTSVVASQVIVMSDNTSDNSRRRFIKLGAVGLAAIPLSNILIRGARAADAVDESSPMAKSLSYISDAAKADQGKRGGADRFCHNCQLYSGKAGDASGPCSIFQGQLVNANGWCSAWTKKAG
jgi:hypothetical protein